MKDILLVGAKNALEFYCEKRDIRLRRNTKCHCKKSMLLDHNPCGPNNFFHTIGFLNIFFSHFLIILVSFKLCPTMLLLYQGHFY